MNRIDAYVPVYEEAIYKIFDRGHIQTFLWLYKKYSHMIEPIINRGIALSYVSGQKQLIRVIKYKSAKNQKRLHKLVLSKVPGLYSFGVDTIVDLVSPGLVIDLSRLDTRRAQNFKTL
jgi:hypothetical protein